MDHDDHDLLTREDFFSSPNQMVMIKRKIIKVNKELASLLDHEDQTPGVGQRIKCLMT